MAVRSSDIGKYGEKLAKMFLERKGYKFVLGNYHSKYGEIDIILKKEPCIIFVEVKLRNKNSLVSAEESVDLNKQKKLMKTALDYLLRNPTNLQPRFDVVSITDEQNKEGKHIIEHIEHIEDAFSLYL